MATYTKETALYDTGAIAGDISDASETASNYLTDITGGGVYVHSADTSSDPTAATAKGVKITDQIDIIREGNSVASFGSTATIGRRANGYSRSEIGTNGMTIIQKDSNGSDVAIAQLGYNSEGGSANTAPYYTFGKRKATTSPYDGTATYSVGDLCVYNNYLFVCRVAIDTPKAEWDQGDWAFAIGNYSTVAGVDCIASGYTSHAEGWETFALGGHAEGKETQSLGNNAHAEGLSAVASGDWSHAEGYATNSSGDWSHAEGRTTQASGTASHAEGSGTIASGSYSHTTGVNTIANMMAQTAIGTYNIADTTPSEEVHSGGTSYGNYALIIGNGTGNNSRSNALAVDWQGRVACGNYSGTLTSIFDLFYPVGSYYETSDTTFNPNIAWGGTWTLETAGKFHVSAGTGYTAGSTGGSAYIQAHTHSFTNPTYKITQTAANVQHAGEYVSVDQAMSWNQGTITSSSSATYKYLRSTASPSAAVHRTTPTIPEKAITRVDSGSVGAINTSGLSTGTAGNMPPYIAVNRWHRTA